MLLQIQRSGASSFWARLSPVRPIQCCSSTTAGGANFTLTIAGSNFVPGAVLVWNGAERTTTFVDASHLAAAIPAADVSKSGSATLAVNNPGASNSNTISFAIN